MVRSSGGRVNAISGRRVLGGPAMARIGGPDAPVATRGSLERLACGAMVLVRGDVTAVSASIGAAVIPIVPIGVNRNSSTRTHQSTRISSTQDEASRGVAHDRSVTIDVDFGHQVSPKIPARRSKSVARSRADDLSACNTFVRRPDAQSERQRTPDAHEAMQRFRQVSDRRSTTVRAPHGDPPCPRSVPQAWTSARWSCSGASGPGCRPAAFIANSSSRTNEHRRF